MIRVIGIGAEPSSLTRAEESIPPKSGQKLLGGQHDEQHDALLNEQRLRRRRRRLQQPAQRQKHKTWASGEFYFVQCSNESSLSVRNCLDEDDPMGLKYRGTRSVSSRQVPCQDWNDLGEWNKFHPNNYPHADLVGNYCRNPDSDKMGPWCFINIKPSRKFQYCKIRTCQLLPLTV